MKRRLLVSFRWGRVVLGAALLLFETAHGHLLPVSTLTLAADAGYLHLSLTLNPFELNFFSELDANRDGRLEVDEWNGRGEQIARRILQAFEFRVDGRPVVANLVGLTQSYESHHIMIRAHFPAHAQGARVFVASKLAGLTSGSHVTEVKLGRGDRAQVARLALSSSSTTFEPAESGAISETASSVEPVGSSANNDVQPFTASQANETVVMVLLGLLLLAGVPPALFCILLRRHREHGLGQVLMSLSPPMGAPSPSPQ